MIAPALGKQDHELFDELAAVLRRHGASERFGVALLHEHFPLAEGEVLHETNDPATRTQSVQVLQEDQLPSTARPTAWSLDGQQPIVTLWCCD